MQKLDDQVAVSLQGNQYQYVKSFAESSIALVHLIAVISYNSAIAHHSSFELGIIYIQCSNRPRGRPHNETVIVHRTRVFINTLHRTVSAGFPAGDTVPLIAFIAKSQCKMRYIHYSVQVFELQITIIDAFEVGKMYFVS